MATTGKALVHDNQELSSLGKYHLIASLGQGGMAKVYLALVPGPGGFSKLLVVKVVQEELLAGSEDSLQLFWDEARLSARLLHPNIVHTYEVGETQGRYFLAMEYLEGKSYRAVQIRARAARLPLEEELRILSKVARGLHYAHELKDYQGQSLGVVHRDVSPQNVFLTYDGQVKVIDFGIAKTEDAAHRTRVGVIKGKLDYIAPEQLHGDGVDRRADVFALGAMLWEAVTGKRFAGGRTVSDVAKVHARITGAEAKLREVRPDVPEPLALIVDRALALDPAARWEDAAAFGEALDGYLDAVGARPSAKSLSSALKTLFEADRVAMQRLVEQRVQAFASGALELDLPNVGGVEHTFSRVLRGASESFTSKSLHENRASSSVHRALQSGVAYGDAARSSSPIPHRHARLALGIGLALTALGGGFVLFPTAQPPVPSERPVAPAAASHVELTRAALAPTASGPLTRAPASPSEAAANASLAIRVTPAEARVSVDGVVLSTPFAGVFHKAATLHRVEAVLRGHLPYRRLVAFDQDRTLEIVLEPAPPPVKRSAPKPDSSGERRSEAVSARVHEAKPAPEQSSTDSIVPGADLGSFRQRGGRADIDMADPYAK